MILSGASPLYRLDHPGGFFFLTADRAEYDHLVNLGWIGRGSGGRVFVEPGSAPDLVALYRLYVPPSGDHFYTTNVSERDAAVGAGYVYEGAVGYVLTRLGPGRRPLYRAYNYLTGQHFSPSTGSSTTRFRRLGLVKASPHIWPIHDIHRRGLLVAILIHSGTCIDAE